MFSNQNNARPALSYDSQSENLCNHGHIIMQYYDFVRFIYYSFLQYSKWSINIYAEKISVGGVGSIQKRSRHHTLPQKTTV